MNKLLISAFIFLSHIAFAQSIEVYDVKQVENNLQVFYNFSGGTGNYTVSLHYSLDNGNTWLGPARAVSGDVGKGVKTGTNKSIVWNVLADREHLKGENLRFKVLATSEGETVTDIDGNVYQTVKIGKQIWMKENLKTTRYQDGSAIPTNLSNSQWQNTSSGAYAIYDEPENDKFYGKLYNWYAVADPRGLCPVGWHVPSDAEWATLENFLGGTNVAGGKMKTTNGWTSPNAKANNNSGFSGFPGGCRGYYGICTGIGGYGYLWSSTEFSTENAWSLSLIYNYGNSYRNNYDKQAGFSVRCLLDSDVNIEKEKLQVVSIIEMANWVWTSEPIVSHQYKEMGKIVFKISVDEDGELVSLKVVEKTVSAALVKIYQEEVERLTFVKKQSSVQPPPISEGKITFYVK